MSKAKANHFAAPVHSLRPPVVGGTRRNHRSGFAVLRLDAEPALIPEAMEINALGDFAAKAGLRQLSEVLRELGLAGSERLVRSVAVRELLEMEKAASRTEFPPLRSLTSYWRLDLRGIAPARVAEVIERLGSCYGVDAAWEEPLSMPALITPGDDPYNAGQGYEDAAPTGIDARWMWTQPGGEGAGIGIIDVEGGWLTTHEDLVGKAPTLIHGAQYAAWVDHGTAVLGEIIATDNVLGVVGAAPSVSSVRMASIYDAAGVQRVTDALVAAAKAVNPGDIMLIELQVNFLPEETQDDALDAIRLAVARGAIVVEAAGNGNTDLDAWTTGGVMRLNRTLPASFVDSGAIMVGASVSTVPHERWWASNFGSRIDCFAWGENVTTTGYGDLDAGGGNPNREYTDTFQGTSSASPIIVSAAALVQSRYKSVTGNVLSPGQMRAILANPATGTPQGATVAGAIGVMPNLAAIAPNLGLVPDLYLRDAVGDTGLVPWGGAISSSPDVIAQPAPVPNPQLAYGEGSGTENINTLGSTVEAGQDNHVYVRVRNRGGAPAANAKATVYWSPVATLVTPSLWTLIGSVTLPNVPVGDVLTVSPDLVWPKTAVPGGGHYCFVANVSHPNDPSPPNPAAMDWTTFQDYIRNQNNVTWCNFNVENNLPDPPASTPDFPFLMTGADDRGVRFAFEVERRLPADARLLLEGPRGLLARIRGRNNWELEDAKERGRARLALPGLPRINLSELVLPAKARYACRFIVRPGKERVRYGHGLAISQRFEKNEVGRITWQFARAHDPCDGERGKSKKRA